MRRYLALLLMLLLALNVHAATLTDKDEYTVDESVLLVVPESAARIIIDAPEARYRLLEGRNTPFIPKSAGTYNITLLDDAGGLLAQDSFTVLEPAEYAVTVDTATVNSPAMIRIAPHPGDVTVQINAPGGHFKYSGTWTDAPFTPKAEGMHEIVISKGGAIIASNSFVVLPETASVAPAENVTNATGEIDVPVGPRALLRNHKGELTEFAMIATNGSAPDTYDLELRSPKRFAKRIVLQGARTRAPEISLDDVPLANARIKGRTLKAFAIDVPFNFSGGYLTGVAEGTELYKCAQWEFASQTCAGTWVKLMDLTPGEEYNITLYPGDPGFAETGVATVNTRKPIYRPGETAEIVMVVLDTQGYLVSGAQVTLTVTAPDNATFTIASPEIIQTQNGIYETSFDVNQEGNYTLFVSASSDAVNSSMETSFAVMSEYAFDIIRNAPATTDPFQGPFDSSISITPFVSTDNDLYDFTEVLPAELAVISAPGAAISTNSANTYLTWSNLSGNATVTYTAQPPLRTPALLVLGRAFITYASGGTLQLFEEFRAWFLAIDPEVTRDQGLVVYMDRSPDGSVKFRNWTGILAAEQDSGLSHTDRGAWIRFRCSEIRPECLLMTSDQGNDIHFAVFDISTWTWRNSTLLDGTVGVDDRQQFDVECEDVTGDCLIVYEDSTALNGDFAYYTWNAAGLSGLGSATPTGAENFDYLWIKLFPQKGTDNIGIALMNDGDGSGSATPAIYAGIWNGTAFGNWRTLTTNGINLPNPGTDRTFFKQFDCAWEGGSTSFVCVYSNNSLNRVLMDRWNGSSWSHVGGIYNVSGTELVEFAACGQEPWSDFTHNDVGIMVCDNGANLDGGIWNGTAFSKSTPSATPAENTNAECGTNKASTEYGRNFECRWERSGEQAVFVWVAASNQDFLTSGTYTRSSQSWSMPNWTTGSQISADTTGNQRMVQLIPNQASDRMFLVYADDAADGGCSDWTGASWDGSGCNNQAVFETGGARPSRQWLTFDYFRTPPPQPEIDIITPAPTSNTYTYVGILSPSSTSKAWDGASTELPPLAANAPIQGTEFVSAGYVNVSTSNDARHGSVVTGSPTGRRALQSFNFTVSDSLISINDIEIIHEGYATETTTQVADQFYIYVYNWTSDSYVLYKTVLPSSVDVISEITITAGFSDLIVNSTMFILIEGDFAIGTGSNARAEVLTDYIGVTVNNVAVLRGTQTFNASAIDDDGFGFCEWRYDYTNGTNASGFTTMVSQSSTDYWYNITNTALIADGVYNVTVFCEDSLANRKNSSVRVRIDNTPPQIALLQPPNATNFTTSSVTFAWNVTDIANENMVCSLRINSTVAASGVVSPHAANTSRTISSIADGTRNWSVTCVDDAGNSNTSESRIFDVDTAAPTITVSAPAAGAFTNNSTVNFTWTATDAHQIVNCSLMLDSVINTTLAPVPGGVLQNITLDLAEGLHYWNITCYDSFGFNRTTTTRNLTVDVTKPTVYLNTSNGIIFNLTVPSLNYTAIDNIDTVMSCNITVQGSVVAANIASPNNTLVNRSIDLPDGMKFWNVTCADDAGNVETSLTRQFSVIGGPYIVLQTPRTNTIGNGTNINFTYFVEDGDGVVNCSLYVNGIFNQTNTTPITNNANNSFTLADLPEGNHTWNVECYDTLNTSGTGTAFNIISDRTPPAITLSAPSDGQTVTVTPTTFSFTVVDTFSPNSTCNLTIDGATVAANRNFNVFNNTLTSRNQVSINGLHYWNVTCIDLGSNTNTSLTRNFTVNVTFPLTVNVDADKTLYIQNEIALINISVQNESSNGKQANITLDYIYTNTSTTDAPWWNTSWAKRKPIYINESSGSARSNKMVAVNVTGLYGSISSCANEIRVIHDSELTEQEVTILDGDDVTYCYIAFNATVNAGASNEQNYHVYYNFSAAPNPGYPNLLSPQTVFSDDFADGNTNGWTASAGWDTSVADPMTGTHAHVDGIVSDAAIRPSTTFDLARFDTVNITFDWMIETVWDGPDYLRVDFTNNSEASWTGAAGVVALDGDVTEGSVVSQTIQLNSSYKVNGFNIRFRATTNDANEDGGFDNFFILGGYALQSNVNTGIGLEHAWIQRNSSETDSQGNLSTNFSTSNRIEGNYSAVARATTVSSNNRPGSGADSFRIVADVFGPIINLTSPANDTTNTTGTVAFLYTAYDIPSLVSNCSLYVNEVFNQTNGTPVNETGTNNFTIANPGEGRYDWRITCYDTLGNQGNSSNYTLWLDDTDPVIIAYSPINVTMPSNNMNFTFNVTDNLDPSIFCNVSVDAGNQSNTTFAASSANTTVTIYNVSDGAHTWNVTCYDNINNSVSSATYNFTIDAFPVVRLHSPPDGYGVNATNITLLFNVTEANLANCSLYLNGAINQTKLAADIPFKDNDGSNNFTLDPINLGSYNWTVACFDNSGFNGTDTTRSFQIDDKYPNLTLGTPAEAETLYSRTIQFNWTVTDEVDPLLACNLTVNGAINQSVQSVSGTETLLNVTGFTVGSHTWSVSCADNTGFSVTSETRNFSIVAIVNIQLNSPANNSLDGDGAVNFTYTPQSIAGFLAGFCELYLDNVANDTHVAPAENAANTFQVTNIPEGNHNWYVGCTDSVGNANVSITRSFIVDSQDPVVATYYPDAVTLNSSSVFFNWTATDNLDTELTCNVRINGTLRGDVASPNGTVTNSTYGGFTDGYHVWNVSCIDDALRTGTSSLKNFTIMEPPTVVLGSPVNNTRTTASSLTLFYTPTDNSGALASCQLILNSQANQTNTSALSSGVQSSVAVNITPEGLYNWTFNCTDPSGNVGTTLPKYFTIDRSGPLITLDYPQNSTAINGNNITFNWTVSDLYAPTVTCNMTVTNTSGNISSSDVTQANGTVFNYTVSDLADGAHNWTVYCRDDLNNLNTSLTFTFQINQPDLDINNSQVSLNNTNPAVGQNVTITANVSNLGGIPASNAVVSFWDGLPGVGVFIGNATGNVPVNGSYLFNVSWNVTVGYHSIWVIVDPAAAIPELNEDNNNASLNMSAVYVNITYPPNNSITNDSTPEIHFNITDFTANNLTYRVYVNGTYNGQNGNVTSNTNVTLNLTSLASGLQRIIIEATDSLGRAQNSSTWVFRIDNAAPTTSFITQNASAFNSTTVTIRFNITDDLSADLNYSVYLDGIFNLSNSTTNASGVNTTFTGLSEGVHTVIVQATDEVLNTANSTVLTFYVDLTAPVPNITTANLSWFNTTSPNISFNITDNLDTILNYSFYVDGSINVNGSVANASNGTALLSGIAEGTHQLILQAHDDAGNYRNSTPISIRVDLTLPTITLVSPANDTNLTDTSVTLNFTAADNMASTLMCDLRLDNAVVQQYNLTNGTYGNYSATGLASGYHYWNVTCLDSALNSNVSTTWRFYVQVPDFVITSGNITFNNTQPIENDTVLINATVFNLGQLNISGNITVQFWLGNPSSGTLLSNQTVQGLNVSQNVTLTTTHTAVIGLNQIYVVIDPPLASNGTYLESDEGNNIANSDFWVGLYEVFAGGSLNSLKISDSSIIAAFTWEQNETTGSNVFVADSESSISFTSLHAIGLNTTNGTDVGTSDFIELDTRMNTTSLNDSVNLTWTANGAPLGYRNITAYKRSIIQIPIVNSTNTSSFVTGILWDTADGGTSYNGTQDAVFVTVMNQSMAGQFGTYDYEIKVPAKLRDYVAGGGTVTFYTELK